MRYLKRAVRGASQAISVVAVVSIGGCGVGQAVMDGTTSAVNWAVMPHVKTMNMKLVARASLNTSELGQSLSVVVRLYQLKDVKSFAHLNYVELQAHDMKLLKADLLATKDVVLSPGASVSIAEPMNAESQYVGVVAFFRDPSPDAPWKIAIPMRQWKKTDPVTIEVNGRELGLVGTHAH